jgi:hypothetical protein
MILHEFTAKGPILVSLLCSYHIPQYIKLSLAPAGQRFARTITNRTVFCLHAGRSITHGKCTCDLSYHEMSFGRIACLGSLYPLYSSCRSLFAKSFLRFFLTIVHHLGTGFFAYRVGIPMDW